MIFNENYSESRKNNICDIDTSQNMLFHILLGDAVIISDFYEELIFCEAKSWNRRPVTIPVKDIVIKVPREHRCKCWICL